MDAEAVPLPRRWLPGLPRQLQLLCLPLYAPVYRFFPSTYSDNRCSGSRPSASLTRAGYSFLWVRSPVAPKMTIRHGSGLETTAIDIEAFTPLIDKLNPAGIPFSCNLRLPLGVENPRHICPAVCMGTEIVPLGLHQIGRQPLPSIGIVVKQSGTKARDRNSKICRQSRYPPQGQLPLAHGLSEVGIQEQIGQICFSGKSGSNLI